MNLKLLFAHKYLITLKLVSPPSPEGYGWRRNFEVLFKVKGISLRSPIFQLMFQVQLAKMRHYQGA